MKRLLPLLALTAACASAPCLAATEEIQVYLDGKEAPGELSVDWHINRTLSGRRTPNYLGEQPPGGVLRITPEFNLGLTDTLEAGLYVLSSHDPASGWHADGAKLRLKYIPQHNPEQGPFWGLNLEVGRSDHRVSDVPWAAEFKMIGGWRTGDWVFGGNANFERGLSPGADPTTMELTFKVMKSLNAQTSVGIESYNELGPISRPSAWAQESKMFYGVLETEVGKVDLHFGLGRGLTHESDRWVFKTIVGTSF